MAGTTKDYNVLVTSSGPGDLWLDLAVPGDAERLTIDSDGTPDATENADALHLGMTKEGCKVSFNAEVLDNFCDELAAPYASKISNETGKIEGEWLQVLDMDIVDKLTLGSTLVTGLSGVEQVTFGGKVAIEDTCAALIWQTKTEGKWAVAMLYRCFNEGGWASQVSRRQGDGTSPLALRALAKTERAAGDQQGTVWRELPAEGP